MQRLFARAFGQSLLATLTVALPTPPADIVSEEVTFTVGSRTIPGTITRPATGTGPGLLLLAGSGPTDRDWNSPLLPGKNGSARLLAESLAAQGMIVLRFDKAYSGKNGGPPITELTLDTYLQEARMGLDLLSRRREVVANQLFVAGHSEGGIHATRLTLVEPSRIRGLILIAAPGRSMRELLITQLERNFRDGAKLPPDQVEAEMKPIREALAAFVAGKDVDPKSASTVPQIQAVLGALMAKPVAAIGRALLSFEPDAAAARLSTPMLVLQGGKDAQVEPVLDAERLVRARRVAQRDVSYHLSPDADHVLKHEPRPMAEVRSNPALLQASYNAEGRVLAEDLVTALRQWVRARTEGGN